MKSAHSFTLCCILIFHYFSWNYDMIFIMNIINMILDLNKILWFFITQITVLENTVLKLQAALNKTNIISKHVCSVVWEVSLKSISVMRNSYAVIIELTTCDTVMNSVMTKQSAMCFFTTVCSVKMLMSVSALNLKLFYTPAKSPECQTCMIRDKCFDCSQKEHTQKSCLTHSFEKICFLLNFKMNWSMNSVSQTDVKINMKFIMKLAAKSVMNMNTHINLSENTWTVFTKKICIVLSVMSWIMFSSKLKNELFWSQVAFWD